MRCVSTAVQWLLVFFSTIFILLMLQAVPVPALKFTYFLLNIFEACWCCYYYIFIRQHYCHTYDFLCALVLLYFSVRFLFADFISLNRKNVTNSKLFYKNTFCIVFMLSAFFAIVYIMCSSSSNTSFKHMYAIWKYTLLMCGVFPVYFLFDFLSLLDMTNVNENEFWLLK